MSQEQKLSSLVRNIFSIQKIIRTLSRGAYGDYSPAEFNFLILVESEQELIASEIAKKLYLQHSKVSRLINCLSQKQAIKTKSCNEDGRRTIVAITAKGKRALKNLDQIANQQTKLWISAFSKEELEIFEKFLSEYSAVLGALPEHIREGEVSIRAQQRRIARVGGLHGKKVFGTELSLLEYHILMMLVEAEKFFPLSELFSLPFDSAEVSRTLSSLDRIGLVNKKKDPKDKRAALVKITSKGRKYYLEQESLIARQFEEATRDFTQKQFSLLLAGSEKAIHSQPHRKV